MEVFTDKFLKREILSPIESLVVITHLILFFITIPLDSVAFLLFCSQKIFPSSAVLTFANAIFSYAAILFTIAAVTSSVLINVMSENIIRRHVKTNAPQNSEVNASTTPLQQSKDSAKLLYEYKRLESGQIRVLELLLADEAQPISCLLHHVDLKTLPEYEAHFLTHGLMLRPSFALDCHYTLHIAIADS
jgi:hypothetical protein